MQSQFTKPFILVTRVGENETGHSYYNPHQRYYEYDTMKALFESARQFPRDAKEKPISALRILPSRDTVFGGPDGSHQAPACADYFHDFTTALEEYCTGIRVPW